MASNLWRPAPWYGWVWEAGDGEDGLLWVPGHTYFMPTANGGDRSGWPHLTYIDAINTVLVVDIYAIKRGNLNLNF